MTQHVPMLTRIDPEDAAILARTPGLEQLYARYVESVQESAAAEFEIGRARKEYAASSDNDIEIDANPPVSPADNGVWVSGWLWVPDEDEEEDEEDEEDDA